MPRSTRSSNGVPYWLVGGQSYVHSRVLIVAARVKESNDRAEANTVMKRTMLRGVWTEYLGGEELRTVLHWWGGGTSGSGRWAFKDFRYIYYTNPTNPPEGDDRKKIHSVTEAGWMTMTAKAWAAAPCLGGVDTESLAWQRCGDVLLQFFP